MQDGIRRAVGAAPAAEPRHAEPSPVGGMEKRRRREERNVVNLHPLRRTSTQRPIGHDGPRATRTSRGRVAMLVVAGISRRKAAPPLGPLVREAEVVAELVRNGAWRASRDAECAAAPGYAAASVRGQADQICAESVRRPWTASMWPSDGSANLSMSVPIRASQSPKSSPESSTSGSS